jgi:hypothetical protein
MAEEECEGDFEERLDPEIEEMVLRQSWFDYIAEAFGQCALPEGDVAWEDLVPPDCELSISQVLDHEVEIRATNDTDRNRHASVITDAVN